MTGRDWSIKDIRDLVWKKFNKRACWFQIKIALALREGKDVVGIAATGAGKTLSFWIPLLMALEEGRDSMIVVVTPLNLLGKKSVEELSAAGIKAVAIDSKTATASVFKVNSVILPSRKKMYSQVIQDIEEGKFNVVVVNPEILMKEKGGFDKLWRRPQVLSRLLHFIYDEGHCISEWAAFREEYGEVGILRHIVSRTIPIYVASATLPPPILEKVKSILQLRSDHTEIIQRSNDRPNVRLVVRELEYPASTYRDLAFLIPSGSGPEKHPPKFLVFFDSTKETQEAAEYLKSRLPEHLKGKVNWFHSTMTPQYREEQFEALKRGEVWGLCVTDAFGMVS